MNEHSKRKYGLGLVDSKDPEIGRALWALEDSRRRTMEVLERLSDDLLASAPPETGNSIGTLIYHIAATEMEWLCVDLLGQEGFSPEITSLLSYGVRDEDGKLVDVGHESLTDHLERLRKTRAYLISVFKTMPLEDYRRPRNMDDYEVTPEWVIHHLMQHEAEHRGQIEDLATLARPPTRGKGAR